jgi:valyl-tRNA synthetase
METILKIVKACRSLRASYNIANKQPTHFYLKISGDGEAAASAQSDDIMTLGKGSAVDINISDDDVPESVGIVVIDDQTTLRMDLTGLVDYAAEVKKLNKTLKSTLPAMQNLEKKMSAAGYEENVKEELKVANIEKLEGLKKKVSDIEEAIANFERLALLEQK